MNVLTIDHVTPLHEACVGDHVACVRALIDAGANVSHVFVFNVAMLHRSNVIAMVEKNGHGSQMSNASLLFLHSLWSY